MGVFPDFGAVGGRDLILQVLGALLTVVLIFAVLMLLVSAIVWAVAAAHGNYQGASRGRIGVLVALGAAALAVAGVAWLNFLVNVGSFGLKSVNFCEKLLSKQRVAAVPGLAFGAEYTLRFSYATGLDVINAGMDRFEEFCHQH